MFNFLFKSGKVQPDLSFVAVDMHSHLLPGIDDGVQEIGDSIEIIRELKLLGYKKLVCTPHILSDLYPNNKKTILPKLDLVRKAVYKAGIDIKIEAAAEYMMDHEFSTLLKSSKKHDLLVIANDYILVEMSYLAPTPDFESILFNLQMLGLTPILAHPERYSYYHRTFEKYERFKELGCKLQVNFGSLSGGYGSEVKRTGERLLKTGMVDFLGTDMHHAGHLNMLKSLTSKKDFYTLAGTSNIINKSLLK